MSRVSIIFETNVFTLVNSRGRTLRELSMMNTRSKGLLLQTPAKTGMGNSTWLIGEQTTVRRGMLCVASILGPRYPTLCCLPQDHPPFGRWKHWGLSGFPSENSHSGVTFPQRAPLFECPELFTWKASSFCLKFCSRAPLWHTGMDFRPLLGTLTIPEPCLNWTQGSLNAPTMACSSLTAPQTTAACEARHAGALLVTSFFFSTFKVVKTAPGQP